MRTIHPADRPKIRMAPVGLFLAGLCLGVLFQKYYGTGHLLATVIPSSASVTQSPDPIRSPTSQRVKVEVSDLASKRVMVALIFGQSNSANFGESPRQAGPNVYNLAHRVLYVAQDPLLGAAGDGGSVWTRLGDEIIGAKLYDAVVFIPIGVDNTHLARWTPGGDLHPRILDAIDDAQAAGLRITHLLWHQGESDNALRTTRMQYRAMLLDMITSIRAHGVTAPMYVSIASRCGDAAPNADIQAAQRDVISLTDGIYPGPDTDSLGPAFRQPDRCHFSDQGLEQFAALWLEALQSQ